jgi:hypothetical protein
MLVYQRVKVCGIEYDLNNVKPSHGWFMGWLIIGITAALVKLSRL